MAKKKAKKTSKKRSQGGVVEKALDPAANKEADAGENKGGLKIEKIEPPKQAKVKPGERLWLNAAKDTLYPEGHPEAATLYCNENKFVNRKEFDALKRGK